MGSISQAPTAIAIARQDLSQRNNDIFCDRITAGSCRKSPWTPLKLDEILTG